MTSVQDIIRRELILKAPRDKVWDAITRPDMLTKWFAHKMTVDKLEVGTEFQFDWRPEHGYSRAVVETIEPKTRFAYRWENDDQEKQLSFADVRKTLVTFVLEDAEGGTRLTLTETDISQMLNPARVFEQNSNGWDTELAELKAYVEAA